MLLQLANYRWKGVMRRIKLIKSEVLTIGCRPNYMFVDPAMQFRRHPGEILLLAARIEAAPMMFKIEARQNPTAFVLDPIIESTAASFPPALPGRPHSPELLGGLIWCDAHVREAL